MTESEFRQHVCDLVADTRGSAGALARKHGLHPKVLTLFLSGARGPSPEVCAAFGYERQYHPITLTPVAAQGDEVREALDEGVATLAAIRATTVSDEEWHEARLHFRDLCAQTIERMNAALATLGAPHEG